MFYAIISYIILTNKETANVISANTNQQMAMNDSLSNLTESEITHLKCSWAKIFSKKIFPFINEDRVKVLYSDNPPNVYFGLLILREVFNQSDEEALTLIH